MKRHHYAAISIALACALSACGKKEEATPATPAAPITAAAPSGSIDAPIPKDAIATRLELVGPVAYLKAEKVLKLRVRVVNQGRAALVSQGKNMVNLGVMLMGPNGPNEPPGKRDFVRFPLPLIAPGTTAEVEGKVPVDALQGLPLRLELVQEGVAWFSAYGQPPLDVGPFKPCANDAHAMCDAKGAALASE